MSQMLQMDLEESMNSDLIQDTLFCICCLDRAGTYINLTTCTHRELLDSFIPHLCQSIPNTVCYNCHEKLKAVSQFKLQVQQSFEMLLNKVNISEKSKHIKRNLKISETSHLSIPEITDVKENHESISKKAVKIKNIETALEILNTNTRSLQSLVSGNNFLGLTETILQATSNNVHFSSLSQPVLPDSKLNNQFSTLYGTSVLPILKKEPNNEYVEAMVSANVQSKEVINNENALQSDIIKERDYIKGRLQSMKNNSNNVGEHVHLSYRNLVLPKDIHEILKTGNLIEKNTLEKNVESDSTTTVLPLENKIHIADDVIPNSCDTTVLPDGIKVNIEDFQDSSKESTTSSQNIINHGASLPRKRGPPPLCLIPIKLSKKELQEEREEKLRSKEFLQWEYRCDQCIIGFLFKENLEDHFNRKHVLKYPDSYTTCDVCQQVVSLSDVRGHKLRHYNRLECVKCKKRFILFDEAYTHYNTVHSHLHNKLAVKRSVKRQLKTYWGSKRPKRDRGDTTEDTLEPSTSETEARTTTGVESSIEVTETLSET